MFTIEHEFDASIITLVDDGAAPLGEDVTIAAFSDCITIEQFDERQNQMQKITLTMTQLRDLQATLDLPEGSYQFKESV